MKKTDKGDYLMVKSGLLVLIIVALTGCSGSRHSRRDSKPKAPAPDTNRELALLRPADEEPVVFCRRCGVHPTEVPTACPNSSSHYFVSASPNSKVVCTRCGIAPTSKPARCQNSSTHNFIVAAPGSVLVCTYCGIAPTDEPVKCPRSSTHNFREFK